MRIIFALCCREFFYIQMEKYARQALSEGIKNTEDLRVSLDSELYRVLNLHYNRNNHIEVRSDNRAVKLWEPVFSSLSNFLLSDSSRSKELSQWTH